jgi:hypothetical protein
VQQHAASGGQEPLNQAKNQKLIITQLFVLFKARKFKKINET